MNTDSGLRTFVRGGQTMLHSIRMFTQVSSTIGGTCLAFAFLVGVTVSFFVNTPYERHVLYKVNEARLYMLFGVDPQKLHLYEGLGADAVRLPLYTIANAPEIRAVYDPAAERVGFWFIAAGVLALVIAAWMVVFFLSRGVDLKRATHLRGAKLVKKRDLDRIVSLHNHGEVNRFKVSQKGQRKPPIYSLNGVPYPYRTETLHTMVAGTTGVGKSATIENLLAQIRAAGDRAVVFDRGYELVSRFYRPDVDIILNPLDQRSPRWSLFADAKSRADFDMLAEAMIPYNPKDPVWPLSARQVLSTTAQLCMSEGIEDNQELARLLLRSTNKELGDFLAGTPAGPMVNEEAEKQSMSVRMTLASSCAVLEVLGDDGEDFSITDWMKNDRGEGVLFLPVQASQMSTLRPLLTAFLDVSVRSMLDMQPSRERTIWFIIDELATLHRLPSLLQGMQEGRKFGAAFVLGVQAQAQLREVYGDDAAETISSLARHKVIMAAADPDTAEWYASALGKREIRRSEESVSMGADTLRDGVAVHAREKIEFLVSPDEVMNMRNLTCYLRFAGGFPVAGVPFTRVDRPVIADRFVARPRANDLIRKTRVERPDDAPKTDRSAGEAGRSGQSDESQSDPKNASAKVVPLHGLKQAEPVDAEAATDSAATVASQQRPAKQQEDGMFL